MVTLLATSAATSIRCDVQIQAKSLSRRTSISPKIRLMARTTRKQALLRLQDEFIEQLLSVQTIRELLLC